MAELPRYRPLGIAIPSVPAVDFTMAGTARARAFDAISKGLDSMTQYVYEKQKLQVAAEGARYGAENAPTQAQLDEAKKEGADISAMLPGDDYTVFGRSARKTSLDVITDQSEMAARQALTALRLEADQTNMPAAELNAKINSLISGYSSNIYQLSPAAGVKFKAGMSTVGNTVLLAHSQSLAKKAEKQQEVVALGAIDKIINETMPLIVQAGSTINQQTGEYVSIEQKLRAERDKIFKFSYAIGDKAIANQKIKAFDDAVSKAKVGAVTDFVLQDVVTNSNALLQGKQLSDPHIQDVLENMSDAERRAALKLSIELADKERSRAAQIDAANERKRADIVDDLLPEITDAKIKGDTNRLYDLLGRLRELDGGKYESIASAIHTEGGVDNAEVVAGLNRLSLNDQLTFEDINTAAKNRQISSNTHLRLLGDLKQQRDSSFKDAVDFAKDELGYPITNKLSFTPEEDVAAQKVAKLRNELRLAVRQNPALDRMDFMIKRVREIQATTTYTPQQISQARIAVKGLGKALQKIGYNISGDMPWETIKAVLDRAVSDNKYDPKKAEGYSQSFKILGSQ